MKKFKLLALAFVIATTSLFAKSIDLPDVPVEVINNQVSELFTTKHKLPITYDKTVNVLFKFDENGRIIVLKIDSKNRDVLNYIRKNMNNKQIDAPVELDRVFIVPLRFQGS